MRHRVRRRTLFLTTLLVALGATEHKAAAGETLRIGVKGDLVTLDPHIYNETFTLGVLANVMEGLVRRDQKLRLRPGLATRWERLTPRRWRFHLRRGVTFHDGSPFTADDVVFSFSRAAKPRAQMQGRLPEGARFVARDSHTLDVFLERPSPALHADWENLLVMSRRWAERHGLEEPGAARRSGPGLAANGTGAYRVVHHRTGEGSHFVRNERWWGEANGAPERVELCTIGNDQTRTAALFAGQVDLIVPAPVQDLKRISSTPGFKRAGGPELRTIFLNMDQMRAELAGARPGTANPLRDKRVRQAIYHAIDIDLIRRIVMRGEAVPAASLVSPLVLHGIETIERLAFAPESARQLLREAGYPDGFSLDMDCPNNRYVNDEAVCQAVAQMLARVAIRVRLSTKPKSLYFQKVLSGGGYDSAFNLLGWTPGGLDAWGVLNSVARCRDSAGNGARFNLGGYCNAEVDRLTAAALVEADPVRRDGMMLDAFRLVHEDVGFIPLYQQTLAWAMSARVTADVRGDNQIRFGAIRIEPPIGPRRAASATPAGAPAQ